MSAVPDIAPEPELRLCREPAEARLTPLERVEALCDPGTFRPIRTGVRSNGARSPAGDAVLAGAGRVRGRTVYCYAQDGRALGGSLGAQGGETIAGTIRQARETRAPVVGFIESGGARLQEGVAALGAYGRIFREIVASSGVVPQISVITGPSAGGAVYSPALTDFTVMAGPRALMFLTGPAVVEAVTRESVTARELGGPGMHEHNGVAHLVTPDELDAADLVRNLLDHLPSAAGEPLPAVPPRPPAPGDPAGVLPEEGWRIYDVRELAARLVDGGELLELQPRWARNMVTGFARIEGEPVGVIANQPRYLGGVIDKEAAQKGARFVRTCDAFGIPLCVLVDTPGFMPGMAQERGAVIRHGAKLLHAFAAASVPRISVILRKAYGGAFIVMNSRDLGADAVFGWPGAEMGVMGAPGAVEIIHRRELAAAPDGEREVLAAELANAYASEHLTAERTAAEGYVDEIIEPAETRERLAWTFGSLAGKRPAGIVGNIPL